MFLAVSSSFSICDTRRVTIDENWWIVINEKKTSMWLRQRQCDYNKGNVITTKPMRLRQKECATYYIASSLLWKGVNSGASGGWAVSIPRVVPVVLLLWQNLWIVINEKRTGMGLRQNGCDDDKGYVITPKRDVITTKGMRLRQKGCDHD